MSTSHDSAVCRALAAVVLGIAVAVPASEDLIADEAPPPKKLPDMEKRSA